MATGLRPRYPPGTRPFGNPMDTRSSTSATGIELSENDLLSGEQNEFASIIDQLRHHPPEGPTSR